MSDNSVRLDLQKIRDVQHMLAAQFNTHHFDAVDQIFGLSEYIGRLIVDHVAANHQAKSDVFVAVQEHIERTIVAGMKARGMINDNTNEVPLQ